MCLEEIVVGMVEAATVEFIREHILDVLAE